MIPRSISASFPHAVRERGDTYFSSARARIIRANSVALTALVEGTAGYVVQLSTEPGVLSASCTCPYAADMGVCKHLWAVLRQADVEAKLAPLVRNMGQDAELVAAYEGDDDAAGIAAVFDSMADPAATQPASSSSRVRRSHAPPATSRQPEWKSVLDAARRQMASLPPTEPEPAATWPADRRIIYIVDLPATANTTGVVIELATEQLTPEGEWAPPAAFRFTPAAWQAAPDLVDRQIAQMLIGAPSNAFGAPARTSGFVLRGAAIATTLRVMCSTGRCRVRRNAGERPSTAVAWDDGAPWELRIRVVREIAGGCFVDAVLRRAGEEMPLSEPVMLHPAGLLLARGAFARFDHGGAFAFVPIFREKRSVQVPDAELPALLETLYLLPRRPDIELPPDARVAELHAPPTPGIVIHPDPSPWRKTHHRLEPFFQYGPHRLTGNEAGASLFDRRTLTVHHRDLPSEAAARDRLAMAGAREEWQYADRGKCLTIHASRLTQLILELVNAGWHVEADGSVYRTAGEPRATVRSGIDWFELDAGVRFGDIEVSIHDLLAARKSGAATIELPDGSRGIIPVDWLARLGPLTSGGSLVGGTLRFTRTQTGLLDALLATLPEASVDETFETARTELRSFESVTPADAPCSFGGTLREYQREGLGWMHFLRKFGLGGCLADDMGLGKTVQVLALLDARRDCRAAAGEPAQPSIVVVPRSLVFNWLREAERFAPTLRMLDHTGVGRRIEDIDGANVDVVVTTYGTLRRDAPALAAIEFDYAILDEAQAIKTATSASAKAARLLRARHRLAMTGTPIENRLEELWSLFEFLNPGMLGPSSKFGALVRLTSEEEEETPVGREVLARALRPVILRRTKDQVARDLPARVEQTLSVDLEGAQRKFYDDLLESYRRSVLERVDTVGIGKARMHILEALLRLRQAACHPVLADPRKASAPSAKLDALIPALDEVVAEGHKAIVFSQFTTFLALVRARLDESGVRYEYLDGRVRDRQSRVDRFQSDDTCSLFLISLKAGGHGLNLTAADYVFILDPWWNPAVEAQAIDRAHRIGQTRRVIATRIVARDTIEEKILELQASKRALADAILGQDQGVLSQIGRAELEALLR